MPLVDNFHITPEQEELFYKSCTKRDGYFGTKVDKKDIVYRKRNFENFVQQSQFPDIATAWNSLTDYVKGLWSSAGQWANRSGWDLFAQDMGYRISNQIEGIGEANIYHQYKIGKITIEAPATSIIIKQDIDVDFTVDVDFSFNYFHQLTSTADPHYAIMFLYYWRNDGFGDELHYEDISFDEDDVWQYNEDTYGFSAGTIWGAYLQIEISNMQGNLYLDGISAINNEINLVNDWQCDTIETSWASVNVPAGASFSSLYSRNSFYDYY